MFVEDNLLTSALWFFMGAIGYRGLSALLFYSKTALIIQRTYIFALDVLWMANESYKASIELKHDMASQKDIEETDALKERELDEELQKLWQFSAINSLITMCPVKHRSALEFKDWHTAMNFRTRTKRQ